MNKLKADIKNRPILYAIIAAFLLIMTFLPAMNVTDYTLQIGILLMLYSYWASAWNLLGGFAGQLSQGHASYIGIGAYVATIMYLYLDITPWIGMFVGGLIAGVFALIIGYPCFQLKGSYYTLSTVALLHVLRIIMSTSDTVFGFKTNAALGMKINWSGESFWGLQFRGKIQYYYIIFIMMILCVCICAFIKNSKTGYYLSAISTNQNAAASLGVNVLGYKLRVSFISAFLTALGGAFYAFLLGSIDPNTMFGYDLSIRVMLLAVVGGRGTLFGPVIGAFMLTYVNEYLRSTYGAVISGISFVFYGLIMMVIVMFLQGGLVSLPAVIKRKFFSKPQAEVKA